MTPAQYMQEMRIERAKLLLTSTQLSIAAIATNVGLPNASHFATVFHAKVGVSPTQYRNSRSYNPQQKSEEDTANESVANEA
jgi:transcriptional regulator GlxA family with amidase domain